MSERRLYVGAPVSCGGWEAYASQPHPDADYSGPLDRLDGLEAGAYSIVYANVINQLDVGTEALRAMHAWRRVLRTGGALVVVGLDPAALGGALEMTLELKDQLALTRLMVQRSHWTAESLAVFLRVAGFGNIRRADRPGFFQDVSELVVAGRRLGLCVLAEAV